MPPRPSRPRRRGPVREPRKRYLLFCEGEVTEPEYFGGWKRFLRSRLISIELSPEQGDPLRLVERAVSAKRTADREARRERDDNLRYDEIWCVLDVDDHARLGEARRLADRQGVHIVMSEPCFELWGLLHYQDHWAYATCSTVCEALNVTYRITISDSILMPFSLNILEHVSGLLD
jgi:RloB-like protein